MSARIDIAGQRFGAWTVLSYKGDRLWICRCSCGAVRDITGYNLRSGVSLGCRACRCGHGTHYESKTRLYMIWAGMLDRCRNPNSPIYSHYGGRGVAVCREWRSFETFREWALGHGYADDLTIERVENDRGYSPSNCVWATRKAQARNRRSSRILEWRGRRVTLAEASEITGLGSSTIWKRLKLGWSPERALSQPIRRAN